MTDKNRVPGWEHFRHGADIGIRGRGRSMAEAFEQGAMALTSVMSDLRTVSPEQAVYIECRGDDAEYLFLDFINEIIFQVAVRGMLFSDFRVRMKDGKLEAGLRGEMIIPDRHRPAVEVKAATMNSLSVNRRGDEWIAQCVVDV